MLNNATPYITPAEFQVSPRPWVTSSIATGVFEQTFDDKANGINEAFVSNWIQVRNNDASRALKVSFTQRGMATNKFFTLNSGQNMDMALRLTSLWLSGSGGTYEILAGLTNVGARQQPNVTGSIGWPGVG